MWVKPSTNNIDYNGKDCRNTVRDWFDSPPPFEAICATKKGYLNKSYGKEGCSIDAIPNMF